MSILCQNVPNCVRMYPTVTAPSLHVHTVSECAAPTPSLHVDTVSKRAAPTPSLHVDTVSKRATPTPSLHVDTVSKLAPNCRNDSWSKQSCPTPAYNYAQICKSGDVSCLLAQLPVQSLALCLPITTHQTASLAMSAVS